MSIWPWVTAKFVKAAEAVAANAFPSHDARVGNPLVGKPLRYLIGADLNVNELVGHSDEITECPYGEPPAQRGISIGYCNLFDELNTWRYGPYLKPTDTALAYGETVPDPRGPGWAKNLNEQFERRKRQGFKYIELDNPDAYLIDDVLGAMELANQYGLKIIAKNPGLMESGAIRYVAYHTVRGIIVEQGAGDPASMQSLRKQAGKPDMPVWFVAFGDGRKWAKMCADQIEGGEFRNMGVSFSRDGEYGSSEDVLAPISKSSRRDATCSQ